MTTDKIDSRVHQTGKATHLAGKTLASEFFALATLWSTMPTEGIKRSGVDAVIAWPGIALEPAVKHAVYYWNKGYGKELLVAGYHVDEDAQSIFGGDMHKRFKIKRPGTVHSQVIARHAGQQGQWTAEMIEKQNIKTAFLCVPGFHSLRALLGVLQHLDNRGINDVLLLPLFPPISPFDANLLDAANNRRDLSVMDVIWGEIDGGPSPRIPAYQKAGQNMSTERFIKWLQWAYEHPLVKSQLIAS